MAQSQDAQSSRSATETRNNCPTLQRGARRRRCRDVAATTAALLLLLCCCFCCSTIRDASRSTIRNADPRCIIYRESRKNVPLRCSIFFIWRSVLTRCAGTKNSNSTSPPPLLLCCCFCCSTIRDASRSTIRDADPRCMYRDSRKKCPASVVHSLHLAFCFDPGCWDQKQQLHAAAARRGWRNEPRHRRQYCS